MTEMKGPKLVCIDHDRVMATSCCAKTTPSVLFKMRSNVGQTLRSITHIVVS